MCRWNQRVRNIQHRTDFWIIFCYFDKIKLVSSSKKFCPGLHHLGASRISNGIISTLRRDQTNQDYQHSGVEVICMILIFVESGTYSYGTSLIIGF